MIISEKKSFLQELYDLKLKYKLPEEQVDDIKVSVDKMIGNIANGIGETERAFEISHKCLAGSMAEGTSIVKPKEFDYLVVLKHLSQPGAVEIYKYTGEQGSCYDDPNIGEGLIPFGYGYTNCHAHIKPGNSIIANMFSPCIIDGHIGNFKMNLMFNECVISVVKTMEDVKGNTGILSTEASDKSGEGCASTFELLWTPKDQEMSKIIISIDLVPAIEIQGIAAARLDPELKAYNERLKMQNKYLIVPGKLAHKCFLYTFTNTEVNIVRSLSQNHKTCYMLLKYLLKIRIRNRAITSYMAKTFVLRHANRCTNDEALHYCIVEIISTIKESFGTLYTDPSFKHKNSMHSDVRCIFMNTNFISTHLYDGNECRAIVDALQAVIKRLEYMHSLENTPGYSFKSCFQALDKFVECLKKHQYVLGIHTHLPEKKNEYGDHFK